MVEKFQQFIEEIVSAHPAIFIVLVIFSVAFIFQLLYYLLFYLRLAFKRKSNVAQNTAQFPVSIIICAKNEEINIERFLPTILEQNYPKYEVIVVNDCSSDDSTLLLNQLKEKYKHLYVTTIVEDKKFSHGKKLALTIGIKAAKHEWLLLTDADCMVESELWLAGMQRNFTEKADFVLGYGGYLKQKGLLNRIIRYDCFFIALQYITFALAGLPYMGVGRNMAYRKSLFFKNKGFASQMDVASGDDDLFVNKLATKSNTRVEYSPESHTRSEPKENFIEWVRQKQRHFSTSRYYKWRHKFLLGGEIFTRFVFYFTLVILLISKTALIIVLSAFVLRLILQEITFYFAAKRLKESDLIWFMPILDIALLFIYFGIAISKLFAPKIQQWK